MVSGGVQSSFVWYAQSVPPFLLVCYVSYQWRNLLSLLLLIFTLYSLVKNIISVIVDSHKMPKSAILLLIFFDVWSGIANLCRYVFLDTTFANGFLDLILKIGRPCPTTETTVHPVNKEVEVRVYKPATISSKSCVVYIHGGGWCFLSARGYNGTVSYMSHYLEMVVVSVEYRLAPDHPFPAGLVDCYNAVQWVQENSEMLGVDPAAVFVGGDSAGGNLSAAVCLLYRDRNGRALNVEDESAEKPKLAGQILLYPVVQGYTNSYGSMLENASYFPPPQTMPHMTSYYTCGNDRFTDWFHNPAKLSNKVPKFWNDILNTEEKENGGVSERDVLKEQKKLAPYGHDVSFEEIMGNSYIFPLHAQDVTGLPPTHVVIARADTLRDEGEWYARYLQQSGIPVTLREVNHLHGFMNRYQKNSIAREELLKIKDFIQENSVCS